MVELIEMPIWVEDSGGPREPWGPDPPCKGAI